MAEHSVDDLSGSNELQSGEEHTLDVDTQPMLALDVPDDASDAALLVVDEQGDEVARLPASGAEALDGRTRAFALASLPKDGKLRAQLVQGDEPLSFAVELSMGTLEPALAGGAVDGDALSVRDWHETTAEESGDVEPLEDRPAGEEDPPPDWPDPRADPPDDDDDGGGSDGSGSEP